MATVLTKFRKHKIFSSKSSPIDVKRHKQSVFTNTIYPSVSDATPAKRDRYEYKEEFAGAGRRRKIRSRTSTRTSLGVHIVTNEYFPSSGIQTAHWPSPSCPQPPLYTCRHIRGGGVDPSTKWDSASVSRKRVSYVRYPSPTTSRRRSLSRPPTTHDPLSPFRPFGYRALCLARARSTLRVLILIRSVHVSPWREAHGNEVQAVSSRLRLLPGGNAT